MRFNRRYLTVLLVANLFTFIVNSALASQHNEVNKILQLLNEQQAEQAFDLAHANLTLFEGEPSFDFAYGMAAQAVRKYHQAIYAFERVVKAHPNSHHARYALATCYYAIGNINAAQIEFSALVQAKQLQKLPRISDYLLAIQQSNKLTEGYFEHSVELGFGADSNANSGIEDEVINIPQIGIIDVFASSQELNDTFWQLQWSTSYNKVINRNASWYGVGKIRTAQYQQHTDMSRHFADLFTGWQKKSGDYKFHLAGFYRPIWLDNDKYLDYFGSSFETSKSFSAAKLGLILTLAKLNYQQPDLDRNQQLATFWYDVSLRELNQRLTASYGVENTDNKLFKHLGRNFWGLGYKVSIPLFTKTGIDIQVDYLDSDYKAEHPLFLQKRQDQLWKLTMNYQQEFAPQWYWLVKVNYLNNQSELVLYDYDRLMAWTAIRYQF